MAGLTREMSSHKVAVWKQLCTSKERMAGGGSKVRGRVEVVEGLTKYHSTAKTASWTRDLGRTALFFSVSRLLHFPPPRTVPHPDVMMTGP